MNCRGETKEEKIKKRNVNEINGSVNKLEIKEKKEKKDKIEKRGKDEATTSKKEN